jgi:hypothetical protein
MKNSKKNYPNQTAYFFAYLIILLIFVTTGCSAIKLQSETTKTPPQVTVIPEVSLSATSSTTPLTAQMLRISNKSTFTIQHLVVGFPQDRIDFGDIPPGATTNYQVIPHGVYRYAAYEVVVGGQKYEQPVVDFIGESPITGKAFTYILDVDPSKWITENQVILLLQVHEDQ